MFDLFKVLKAYKDLVLAHSSKWSWLRIIIGGAFEPSFVFIFTDMVYQVILNIALLQYILQSLNSGRDMS